MGDGPTTIDDDSIDEFFDKIENSSGPSGVIPFGWLKEP